ncbi:hypothetical protein LEP1GSC047_2873 [Leptospira inadai serovar Lyme str. 10]|uniref:Uncharacterized protein n=2 Tax=Leptospira inadai serovar Lyme TaxID=293084 RepID=V6HI58_9LEPT|nr:hypothetical protein LEP1GSC047_2873 [Leptospira inadai serovar Lyme str. 10]PNV73645.1 hypothetical protein BES34_016465 [Leptospira inadai serovar Lyme]
MNGLKWYSIEYFEELLGRSSYLSALKKVKTLRDIASMQTSQTMAQRSIKNSNFILGLLLKVRHLKNRIVWLRSQIQERKDQSSRMKSEINFLKREIDSPKTELVPMEKALTFDHKHPLILGDNR